MLTYRNKKKGFKILFFIVIILNFLVPMILINANNNINNYPEYSNNTSDKTYPKTQGFFKNNYDPILNQEKQGLGSINITDISFDDIGFNSSDSEPNIISDLSNKALNMTYQGTKFINTTKVAQVDNINENITDNEKVTILLNESISVSYYNPIEEYLIYAPRLTPFVEIQLWVENETANIIKVHKEHYSVEKIDNINFLLFNYKNHYKYNFTFHLIWEYNLTINNWNLNQDDNQELLIEELNQILNPKFNYKFNLVGYQYKYNNDTKDYDEIPADNLLVNLTINLPDKELLSNHNMKINLINVEVDFLTKDKSLYTKSWVKANNSKFDIEFTAYYIITFFDPVDETWSIDRLVEDKDKRERIYFPTIITGPKHIYIKNLKILEETIGYDQVESQSSLFGRPVSFIEINVSKIEEEIRNSLIFTENATKHQGILITLPYLIYEEVCPFTFKYETDKDLRIVVTDNIHMPIVGLDVVIYYYGEKYGTYMSNEKNQPIGPTITDENGEILVENVPNGNYTLKIFTDNKLITEAEVSSFLDVNYVVTPIIHFPLWILIFGIISGIILGLGFKIYKKQKVS